MRSEIPLPELQPLENEGDPDVVVRVGAVNGAALTAGLHKVEGAMIYVAPDAARYRISNGSEIMVQLNPAVPERNVRLYLLGSAFGALLHQRGLLPLHANAIEIDGEAVAFMGPSGAGKSTLAAWFHDQGFPLIADDVCVVRTADGATSVLPGLPRFRLWQDALEASGRRAEDFSRSYDGDDHWNKFDVGADRKREQGSAVPLAMLFTLQTGTEVRFIRQSPLEATDSVFANTYRGRLLEKAGDRAAHWRAAIGLVRTTPIFSAELPWDASRLDLNYRELLTGVRALLDENRRL